MSNCRLLFAFCTMQMRELNLDRTASDIDGAYLLLLQAQMDARQAQAEQKVSMRAQQLAAGKVQLAQQQARLVRQEAELSARQTALQERVKVCSKTHSRPTGTTVGGFSFVVSVCCF